MGAIVGLGSSKCLADQVRLLKPRSVGALGHVGSFHGQAALASLLFLYATSQRKDGVEMVSRPNGIILIRESRWLRLRAHLAARILSPQQY